MAEKGNHKKKKQFLTYISHLQPLSTEEKEELKMRIYMAICQSTAIK
ncbi:MAG: hypothetical protein IJV17_00715 [Prevotella sp.]|nr:hypothetical protein [Prevotella sp.]